MSFALQVPAKLLKFLIADLTESHQRMVRELAAAASVSQQQQQQQQQATVSTGGGAAPSLSPPPPSSAAPTAPSPSQSKSLLARQSHQAMQLLLYDLERGAVAPI